MKLPKMRKLHIVLAVLAVAALSWGGYSLAKLENIVPEWSTQPPIKYLSNVPASPPGWVLNERFGTWAVKTCKFGEVEAQCSYAVQSDHVPNKEVSDKAQSEINLK